MSRTFGSVSGFVRREIVAAWPVFLFFLLGFLLLLLLVKLVLADFSIQMTALSKAIVGALLAAKAVLILDETPLAHALERYRRIVAVAAKTFFYGGVTLLLGYLEQILEAARREHGLEVSVQNVIADAKLDRLLAWALGVSLVFGIYFTLSEMGKRMGEGEIWRLFFERPDTVSHSTHTRT